MISWRVVQTRPAVPSAVSYEDAREGNDLYRPLGYGTPQSLDWRLHREKGVCASIRRRRGWMDGRVNTCELSIHVVMSDKPKMLRGLSQKALERVQSLDNTLSWTSNTPGGQRAPNPFESILRNVVSPYCSCRKGREAARPTNGSAGRGVGKSECRSVMEWIRVATSPDAQAGRRPCGVSARESRRNRSSRCCK